MTEIESRSPAPAPLPPPVGLPAPAGGFTKFRNEMLAGGTDGPPTDDTAGGPRAFVGLAIILALLVALGMWSGWALVFVIGLLVCVFLHELGHFLSARLTGMKATQFFLFMGPKLWSFRRGETEYGVRAYPIGAFVRIIGMNNLDEVPAEDEPRAYRNKSYPRRLLVITAGSLMHMIIALGLVFAVFAVNGQRVESGRVGIGVAEGGPAAVAGLRTNDIIVSIDGATPTDPDDFVARIRAHQPGDEVEVVVERDGEQVLYVVELGTNPNPGAARGTAYLGVSSGERTVWSNGPVTEALPAALADLRAVAWESITGVAKVLNPATIVGHLTGSNDDPATRPSTVVGITRATEDVGIETGFGGVMLVLAYVNVFIGLFNMIPLLPFDGGHAAIATYERLRSRRGQQPYRADVSKMVPVALTTMVLLGFLFVSAFYLDIVKT